MIALYQRGNKYTGSLDFLLQDVFGEVTNDVTSGPVLADQERSAIASVQRAADRGRGDPDHLGEVASTLAELAGSIVVINVLVVPRLHCAVRRAVTHGNVLAVRASRVLEYTVVRGQVVGSELRNGGVPHHWTGLVLRTYHIVVVDDVLLE